MLYALLLLAVVPGVVLVLYFRSKDALQPEPWRVIRRSCLAGALTVIPAGLLEHFAMEGPKGFDLPRGLFYTFVVIALTEEVCKLLAILLVPARDPHFDEPIDGLVYGASVAAGFATFENVFYVLNGGFGIAVARAVFSVPLHIFEGAILGRGVARVRFAGASPARAYGWALFLSVALHGFFDFGCLFAQHAAWLLLLVPLSLVTAWRFLRAYVREASPSLPATAPPSPAPEAPPATSPEPSRLDGLVRTLFLVLGILALCFGAFLALGVVALAAQDGFEAVHLVITGLPLAAGCYLIRKGRRGAPGPHDALTGSADRGRQ